MRGIRRRRRGQAAKLEMTPMIDVVFLLLVFFVLTISQQDILSKLNVSRPQAGGGEDIPTLRINLLSDGYTINGRKAELSFIEKRLAKLVSFAPGQSLIVACSPDSKHSG
ncbi:biopolymer transporter ExbD, partial [PVC group bacterium]|nr:biopolymer transporter ExbD [PVC group bacterium]